MSIPDRPTIYNRPWHMDQDERRHRGRRQWEPGAIEALVGLLSTLDGLYPPDWSDRDVVRFRAAGASGPLAELWTDKPSALRLIVHVASPPKLSIAGCRIRTGRRRCEVLLKSPDPLGAAALKDLIVAAVSESLGRSGGA
jgi:hypothetical protein